MSNEKDNSIRIECKDSILKVLGMMVGDVDSIQRIAIQHHEVELDGEVVQVSSITAFVGGHIEFEFVDEENEQNG